MDVGTHERLAPRASRAGCAESWARIDAEMPLESVEADYPRRSRSALGVIGTARVRLAWWPAWTQAFCRHVAQARPPCRPRASLYLCLFASQGYDLRSLLRGGASDAPGCRPRFGRIWGARSDRYSELRGLSTTGRRRQSRNVLHRRLNSLRALRAAARSRGGGCADQLQAEVLVKARAPRAA